MRAHVCILRHGGHTLRSRDSRKLRTDPTSGGREQEVKYSKGSSLLADGWAAAPLTIGHRVSSPHLHSPLSPCLISSLHVRALCPQEVVSWLGLCVRASSCVCVCVRACACVCACARSRSRVSNFAVNSIAGKLSSSFTSSTCFSSSSRVVGTTASLCSKLDLSAGADSGSSTT